MAHGTTMTSCLLFLVKALLITIDLIITAVTFGWVGAVRKIFRKQPLRSVPVDDDDPSHRVDPAYKTALIETPRSGVATLYDLVQDAVLRFECHKCLSCRSFLGWKVPGKVKEFSQTVKCWSFCDVGHQAHQFGAALVAAGLAAAPNTTDLNPPSTDRPCRVAIFENTCPEWMIGAIGAFSQSITVVTVYATLGMDAVVEAIQDSSISLVVCNYKDLGRLVEQCHRMPSLRTMVYTIDMVAPTDRITMPDNVPKDVMIVSFDDFYASGDTTRYPPVPPSPDTCAVIMYTSGSTGKPKGVVITHRQVVATCAGAEVAIGVQQGTDVYLAYLPLAHILEFMAEFIMISQGNLICYADPKSLTSSGSYPIGALEQFSPTLMAAVPKIWEVFQKNIQAKTIAGGSLTRFLVETAFEWRGFALKHGFDTPLFKLLVFRKLAKVTGGRLRLALSAGGPLHHKVQECIRTAFGIVFVQGYGLTETVAGIAVQARDDFRTGIAGKPIASVQVKLESTDICDRLGCPCSCTNRVDVDGNPVFGRGEIIVRGPGVSVGYYIMPEETKANYKDNGWFYTGDIGQFMSDGSLRIVDRKKNLVKLKCGEYIALEKMEMVYGNSTFVNAMAGGILCYGDGDMDRPVALVQLDETVALKWAKDSGIAGDIVALKQSDQLRQAILNDLNKEHAKSDLSHLEKLVGVAVLSAAWTTENQCLTAANKLDRRRIIQQCQEFEEAKAKGIF